MPGVVGTGILEEKSPENNELYELPEVERFCVTVFVLKPDPEKVTVPLMVALEHVVASTVASKGIEELGEYCA